MPNRDGTGPEGKGPLTGRGFGRCKGAKKGTDDARQGSGRGRGMGLGRGRGRGLGRRSQED